MFFEWTPSSFSLFSAKYFLTCIGKKVVFLKAPPPSSKKKKKSKKPQSFRVENVHILKQPSADDLALDYTTRPGRWVEEPRGRRWNSTQSPFPCRAPLSDCVHSSSDSWRTLVADNRQLPARHSNSDTTSKLFH